MILGPAMGALLADPAKQYPSIRFFQSSFFKTYPFFLPCGVAAGLAFAASLMVLVCFNEVSQRANRVIIQARGIADFCLRPFILILCCRPWTRKLLQERRPPHSKTKRNPCLQLNPRRKTMTSRP